MALKAQLWTLNGLSVELKRNVRTLGRALTGVQPDGWVGKNPAWFMETAIEALKRHEGTSTTGRASGNAEVIASELQEIALAFDEGLNRLRKEPDMARRRDMAAEIGPLVGKMERALTRSLELLPDYERAWQAQATDAALLAPMIQEFMRITGFTLAA